MTMTMPMNGRNSHKGEEIPAPRKPAEVLDPLEKEAVDKRIERTKYDEAHRAARDYIRRFTTGVSDDGEGCLYDHFLNGGLSVCEKCRFVFRSGSACEICAAALDFIGEGDIRSAGELIDGYAIDEADMETLLAKRRGEWVELLASLRMFAYNACDLLILGPSVNALKESRAKYAAG